MNVIMQQKAGSVLKMFQFTNVFIFIFSYHFLTSKAVSEKEFQNWLKSVEDLKYECPRIDNLKKNVGSEEFSKIIEVVDCQEEGAIFRYDYRVTYGLFYVNHGT